MRWNKEKQDFETFDPNPPTDPNREFAELVGVQWHEQVSTKEDGYGCSCGFLTYFGGMYSEHIRDNSNPDYAADPRLVLREIDRLKKRESFINYLLRTENTWSIPDMVFNLIIDTTGKFRDKAIRFMRKEARS